MKDQLATLISLQKTKVDEQQAILARLYLQYDAIVEKKNRLEGDKIKQDELLNENPDMGMTYANYLRQYLKRREAYAKELKVMEKAIDMARDKLALLFEEQKRYEIAKEQRDEEVRQKELAEERKTLDEVGSVGFQRQRQRKRKGA